MPVSGLIYEVVELLSGLLPEVPFPATSIGIYDNIQWTGLYSSPEGDAGINAFGREHMLKIRFGKIDLADVFAAMRTEASSGTTSG